MRSCARLTVCWSARSADEWLRALRRSGNRSVIAVVARGASGSAGLRAALGGAESMPTRTLAELRREERTSAHRHADHRCAPLERRRGLREGRSHRRRRRASPKSIRAPCRSRLHRNLFLCGELLDAFGPIGGYNFLWAWATGRAAVSERHMRHEMRTENRCSMTVMPASWTRNFRSAMAPPTARRR